MDTSYRFTSDVEPTEKQLDNLMKEVLIEVNESKKIAELNLKKLQEIQFLALAKRAKVFQKT